MQAGVELKAEKGGGGRVSPCHTLFSIRFLGHRGARTAALLRYSLGLVSQWLARCYSVTALPTVSSPPPSPQPRCRKWVAPGRCREKWKHKAEGPRGAWVPLCASRGGKLGGPASTPARPGVRFAPGRAVRLRSGWRRWAVVTAPGRAVRLTVWLHLSAGQVPGPQRVGPCGPPGPPFLSPPLPLCLCLAVRLSVWLSLSFPPPALISLSSSFPFFFLSTFILTYGRTELHF